MKEMCRISEVILLCAFIFLNNSCRKEKPILPKITTTAVTEISSTTAVSGGDLTKEGESPVISKGICWKTSDSPTIENNKTIEVGGIGLFTSSIEQLIPNTLYFVRAYATDLTVTVYGNQVSFTTSQVEVPFLTTWPANSISQTAAYSGGSITSDNGGSVTAKGVCWSINQSPTIADFKSTDGPGTGEFWCSITGLTKGTTYHLRAYATNSAGTGYGSDLQFTTESGIIFNPNLTYGSVTDIEGNIYRTINIGAQTWFAENLKTTKYNDNTTVPFVIDNIAWRASAPGYCWYNNDASTYKANYGALYNWYAVDASSNGHKNLCPTSWHVPTNVEWTTLTDYLINNSYGYQGNRSEIGMSMAATTGWITFPQAGTIGNDQASNNSSGFSVLPGGQRVEYGTYYYIGAVAYFWSATEVNENKSFAWHRALSNGEGYVYCDSVHFYNPLHDTNCGRIHKVYGFSVRCLKD